MYDAVVVGGGPAGLNAALMLGRACRQVVVIDAGRPRNSAARQMHGFLGRDGTHPSELLAAGREEVGRYGVEMIGDLVSSAEIIDKSATYPYESGFAITTSQGRRLASRKLLLATGVWDELPDLPGVKECYGTTVHHCPYCDGWEHRGKHLLAFATTAKGSIGLGLSLRGWSEKVTVLTNGQDVSRRERRRLCNNEIAFREEVVLGFKQSAGRLEAVQLAGGEYVVADAMFFNTAMRPNSAELLRDLGCRLDGNGLARTRGKQKTNVKGLYLAGDADGDVQFVIVAAAEGATAAVAINRELQDEDRAT